MDLSLVISRLARAGVVLGASVAIACGGAADAEDGDSLAAADTAAAEAPAAAPAPAAEPADAAIAVADIDRWQRGMEAELQAVDDASARLRAAKDAADSANAVLTTTESSTRAAGAAAAGVDESRYARIRGDLSEIVSQMTPLEMEMNVSAMPANMVAEMRRTREEGLARLAAAMPADVVEALRPRAEALRKQELSLVGARMKAAGIAR